jgi:NAD(P)-dependent dehydrogenase (short-subunit alcohol dehydrogenase family)
VNFFGYLRTIQAVVPIMKAQGGGIIHNVSSGVGLTGFPGASGYASSKGAIEAFSRTLRLELVRYNIWVTIVHPPLTYTRSSALLGIPPSSMADPLVVGCKLATHMLSTKAVITVDFRTALGLLFSRLFPAMMGRVLSILTQRMG